MFRFNILEEAEKYLAQQNIAAFLNRDSENPNMSNLIVDLGNNTVSGFDRNFLLNIIFRHGESKWEELALDVMQIRSVMLADLSDKTMKELDKVLSFLLPELEAGCIYIDREARMLVFSHDIVVGRGATVDSVISQLDGFLFLVIIYAAVFFDPLYETVLSNLTADAGIELIRSKAFVAQQAVRNTVLNNPAGIHLVPEAEG